MIKTHIEGPWVVDNTRMSDWAIYNTETGKSKIIGPINGKRANYYVKAYNEAVKRNLSLRSA